MNGIGGSTVEEAKERLTEEEFLAWASFRKQFGTLNLGWRLEWENAKLRAQLFNYMRGSDTAPKGPDDLMEHWPEDDRPAEEFYQDTTQAIIGMMKAQKAKG